MLYFAYIPEPIAFFDNDTIFVQFIDLSLLVLVAPPIINANADKSIASLPAIHFPPSLLVQLYLLVSILMQCSLFLWPSREHERTSIS
jgi:hypothetical protein